MEEGRRRRWLVVRPGAKKRGGRGSKVSLLVEENLANIRIAAPNAEAQVKGTFFVVRCDDDDDDCDAMIAALIAVRNVKAVSLATLVAFEASSVETILGVADLPKEPSTCMVALHCVSLALLQHPQDLHARTKAALVERGWSIGKDGSPFTLHLDVGEMGIFVSVNSQAGIVSHRRLKAAERGSECLLVRFAPELYLKGENRSIMIEDLRRAVSVKLGTLARSMHVETNLHIVVSCHTQENLQRCALLCTEIAGISHVLRCVTCATGNLDGIVNVLMSHFGSLLSDAQKGVRIDAKMRNGCTLTETQIVDALRANPNVKATLTLGESATRICVHGIANALHVVLEQYQGIGGVPISFEQTTTAVSLLSGGFDSPVASYLAMKRGLAVELIHFQNAAALAMSDVKEKVTRIAAELARFQPKTRLTIVPFSELQQAIIACESIPAGDRMIVYRAIMLRIASASGKRPPSFLLTGDSLHQVASQTVRNLETVHRSSPTPLLTPLIGMDKDDIIAIAQRIGTAALSALPYGDCCSFFLPEHPSLHLRDYDPQLLTRHLASIPHLDDLCKRALSSSSVVRFRQLNGGVEHIVLREVRIRPDEAVCIRALEDAAAAAAAAVELDVGKEQQGGEEIFLDAAATTTPDPSVVASMMRWLTVPANAHSIHGPGRAAAQALGEARASVAASLGVASAEVIFTSSATEATSLAFSLKEPGGHLVTLATEHSSVLEATRASLGRTHSIVGVDERGLVRQDEFVAAISVPGTVLVSVQFVNNETGCIQDVMKCLGHVRRLAPKALFHVDACQAVGKVNDLRVFREADLITISGHKMNAPTGVAALIAREKVQSLLRPLHCGTGHSSLRAGTPAVHLAVALARALQLPDARPTKGSVKESKASVSRKNLSNLTLSASGRAQFKLSSKSASRLFLSSSSTEQADSEQLFESMAWGWGSGKYGRLGIGNSVDASVPTPVVEFVSRNVSQVACGSFVTAFLVDGGSLWMSGKDIHGLFCGTVSDQKLHDDFLTPVEITHFSSMRLRQIAVGEKLCVAISEFGELYWWGDPFGRTVQTLPALSSLLPKRPTVTEVQCGLDHTLALCSDGSLLAWGSNVTRQLGHGPASDFVTTPTSVSLPAAIGLVKAIACSFNSSAVLSAKGNVVAACGSIVGQRDWQIIQPLTDTLPCIKTVYCNDWYVAAVNIYGDAYLWHSGPVPFLDSSLPTSHAPCVRVFEDYSVRELVCGSDYLACLTDSGALHAWGRCSLQLGLGEVRAKKHIVGPKLIGTFSARYVRHASCGPNHLGAVVLPTSASREMIGWELLESERIYLRSLSMVISVYRAQCKPRSTLAKLVAEVEAMVKPHTEVMEDMEARMASWTDSACFGPLFQRLSSKRFIETYTRFQRMHGEWSKKAHSQFQPGGKMFAEGEQLLPAAMSIRKTDSAFERQKPVHLVGLLLEPMERVRQYFWLCSRLRQATPEWHADAKDLAACAEQFHRELSGYCSEHEMAQMTILRLEGDKAELLKKLAILSTTNDNLFLSRNHHEMQKRDLTDMLEQHEHKIRTITRETDQLKERILGLFLEKRRETLQKRRAEAAAQRALEEARVFETEARRLQVELDQSRSLKIYRELVEQKRISDERSVRIIELERALSKAQEATIEQRYTDQHVRNLEVESDRLMRELTATRTALVDAIRRQHSPIMEVGVPATQGVGPFFSSDGSVRGATVEGLVSLLVSLEDKSFVQPYLRAFFLTYRVFITPIELAYSLQELYCKIPKSSDPPTQWSRVLGVLRFWITEHVDDFKLVPGMKSLLWGFLEETVCVTLSPSTADAIMKDFHKQIMGDERLAREQEEIRAKLAPTSAESVPIDVSMVSAANASEIAQQLMLIEHELMSTMQPKELLGCGWLKGDKEMRAPAITALTGRFNAVSAWVVSEVLARTDIKDRRECISVFIAIAQKARALGSFNTALELVAGLNNGAVQRLKRTWADLSRKDRTTFEELEAFVSPKGSYHQMREAVGTLVAQELPCMPYLGVYLADLVMMDEGSKPELSPGVVNFSKLMGIANIIQDVIRFTRVAPTAAVVPRIRAYLIHCAVLPNDDAAWGASQDLEPKQ